ncbi:MAG: 2'-deoxycytidine 5'-triphosphate deaminase [Pseudomonadota bacterium]
MNETGVLPDAAIQGLIDQGQIESRGALSPDQIQPASLDLTLGERAWRVRASFLPSGSRNVAARLHDGLAMHEIALGDGAVLERGCVYLVELNESLNLPADIAACANPKSSTGRIDVFVRMVVDGGATFDETPPGYAGPLYAEISPRTFSILVRRGSSLNQLRLKKGRPQLDDQSLKALHQKTRLIDRDADIDDGIGVRIDLTSQSGGPIGWRARRHSGLIDVDKRGALNANDFFEAIKPAGSNSIILDPDEFYILRSKEHLLVPPENAAEMTPINTGLGEFRVHYAGFFDPGFGWSADAKTPRSRGVLEVRSHDAPFLLDDGQLVARLVYERMLARPKRLYGADLSSNYQGQGLRLSKHFSDN